MYKILSTLCKKCLGPSLLPDLTLIRVSRLPSYLYKSHYFKSSQILTSLNWVSWSETTKQGRAFCIFPEGVWEDKECFSHFSDFSQVMDSQRVDWLKKTLSQRLSELKDVSHHLCKEQNNAMARC